MNQIHNIERLANEAVMTDTHVETKWMPRETAEAEFGFRIYQGGVVPGKEIRIVKIGDRNVEACGGTHCKSTGEIGLIKILKSERIQDGVERILFATGSPAVRHIQQEETRTRAVAETLGAPVEHLEKTAEDTLAELKALRKEVERLKEKIARYEATDLSKMAKQIRNVKVLKRMMERGDVETLIKTGNELVKTETELVTVFLGVSEATVKVVVMAGEKAVQSGVNAGKIAAEVSRLLGGGGGGKPNFGQGGGQQLNKVAEALEAVEGIVEKLLRRS
jgi:alanyl-tRNA synthetase